MPAKKPFDKFKKTSNDVLYERRFLPQSSLKSRILESYNASTVIEAKKKSVLVNDFFLKKKGSRFETIASRCGQKLIDEVIQICGKVLFYDVVEASAPIIVADALNNCGAGYRFGSMIRASGNAQNFGKALVFANPNFKAVFELFDKNPPKFNQELKEFIRTMKAKAKKKK